MNEITNIHLGRQPYKIAVDAHGILQDYMHDIKEQVGPKGKDVVDEVELRMAELLAERGITGDKVILMKDVEYLKEQLGSPRDFKDEDEGANKDETETTGTKRLYRDTDHGMVAGVAAGLAAYFHIDPVIVRLLFVIAALTGGWGFALYIVMWLIVPEAKTSSDRLHMWGKAVTVDNLKEVVHQADVKGAAARAGNAVGSIVQNISKLVLMIVGIAFTVAGCAVLFGLTTGGVYWWLNHGRIVPFDIFPIGAQEILLSALVFVVLGVMGLLWILMGVSMAKRKWQLPGWALAGLLGVMFAALAVGGALAADAIPKIRDRIEAAHHSDMRQVVPFTAVHVDGDPNASRLLEVVRKNADEYKIELRYMGKADTSGVMVKEVKPGTLEVDTRNFKSDSHCAASPCVFKDRDLQVFVYAPAAEQIPISSTGTAWEYTGPSDPFVLQTAPNTPPMP